MIPVSEHARRPSRIVGQAYPWDLIDDPTRATKWRALGITTIAMPRTYHAVRAISWRADASPRVVQTVRSGELPGFEAAFREARDAGVTVIPWLVLSHDDGIEPDAPRCGRDAWGNRSWTGACPSSPVTRQAHIQRVASTVTDFDVTDVLIENVTPPGFDHPWPHDKTLLSRIGPRWARLLSLCYCEGCCAVLSSAGRDPERDAAVVRDAFHGRADATAEIAAWFAARRTTALAFVTELRDAAGGARITVAATRAEDTFGPRAPLPNPPQDVTAMVHLEQSGSEDDARHWRSAGICTAGMLLLDDDQGLDRAAAVDDLYLYHIGMASPELLPARLDRIRSALLKGHDHA